MSDLDYQTKSSVLFAHWGGFSDPHTAVKEYIVSVGTTKGGQDAVDTQAVGLVTGRVHLSYLLKLTEFV